MAVVRKKIGVKPRVAGTNPRLLAARRPADRVVKDAKSRAGRGIDPFSGQPYGRMRAIAVALALVFFAVATVMVGTVYYFNKFVRLEQNVHTAIAQTDRELQRRRDLIDNLLPAVFEYAQLEQDVFSQIAHVRSQTGGVDRSVLTENPSETSELADAVGAATAGALPMGSLFRRLVAVSEQYPDMKSSGPFNILMEKIVEIEDRVAVERKTYNDCVNMYTTVTASFPGRLFALIFGFKSYELFGAEPGARDNPSIGWPAELAERHHG